MVYLDNNATTRPSEQVIDAVADCMRNQIVNPASSLAHQVMFESPLFCAARAMKVLLNAEEQTCFTFTSGATEANNWAIAMLARVAPSGLILTSGMEHPSVSEPLRELQLRPPYEVAEVPTKPNGVIDLDALSSLLSGRVIGVSIMAANNVTGAIQPLAEIGSLIRHHAPGALFHTDATQAVGKMVFDVRGDFGSVDLASFSAHKFHGPRGIGGLYVRPGISLSPMILGGGQGEGLRSGTENSPGLAGLAIAAVEATNLGFAMAGQLRNEFEAGLRRVCPFAVVHAEDAPRLPNTSSFSLPGFVNDLVAERLVRHGIVVGLGAACSSGSIGPPKSLMAMGIDYELAKSSLRVSSSRETTEADFNGLLGALPACLY